jgi:hypothetical protein
LIKTMIDHDLNDAKKEKILIDNQWLKEIQKFILLDTLV